jgi:hypothetical protein
VVPGSVEGFPWVLIVCSLRCWFGEVPVFWACCLYVCCRKRLSLGWLLCLSGPVCVWWETESLIH